MSASKQSNGLRRLDLKTYKGKVEDLILAQQTKKEADAASRAADVTIKSIVADLTAAMDGAPAALCGNAVLTIRESAPAPAALTLKDGSKKLLSEITAYLFGNTSVKPADVLTVFGGRGGSQTLNCTGTP